MPRPTYEELERRAAGLEDIYRTLLENAGEAILIAQDGRICLMNPAAREAIDYRSEEVEDRPFIDFVHPDDREMVAENHLRRIRGERFPSRYPFRVLRRDGEVRWVEIHSVRIEWRGWPATLNFLTDTTDRRKAEAALRDSEARMALAVTGADLGVWDWFVQTGEAVYNEAWGRMLGLNPDEVPPNARSWEERVHPEDWPRVREGVRRHFEGQADMYHCEFRLRTKAGGWHWVYSSGKVFERDADGRPVRMTGIHLDVDRRKRAEQNLQENEERFRAIFEGSLDAVLLADPETGRIIDANPAAQDLFRRSREGLVDLPYTAFFPERLVRRAHETFQRIVGSQDQLLPAETIVLQEDGTERPVEFTAHIIQIDGRPIMYAVFRDITERKRAEEALRFAQFSVDRAADAIFWMDEDGWILHANDAACSGLGYSREELLERRVMDVDPNFPEEDWPGHWKRIKEQGSVTLESTHRTKDGRVFPVEISVNYLAFEGREYHVTFARDLTHRRQIEAELLKVQKLESLGILAGGIAHDFNNYLTAVLANLAVARTYGQIDPESARILEEAERASIQAKGLTKKLLAFARGGAPVRNPASVAGLLRDTVDFCLRGSKIARTFSIPDDLWTVDVDPDQIAQVIHNAVINAEQAMPGGGTLQVSAANLAGAPEGSPLPGGKPCVRISIADEGVGIPPDLLPSIFDPFFTTKQKGSGLGLSISHSIIRSHEGEIRVASEPGVGTTFSIYLPRSSAPAPAARTSPGPERVAGGRVLVMDDEEMVRNATRLTLEKLGYEVEVAIEGEAALALYAEALRAGRPFNAVIMDLTVAGGMGGEEAVRKLLEMDPDARAVVASGYSTDPILASHRAHGFRGVLLKPFEIEQLAETMREVMAGR